MRKLFVVLLLLIAFDWFPVKAQSDDITQMGNISPLFYLEKSFREEVITASGEHLFVEVSSIAVERTRVLVRFFISDLTQDWKSKISDDLRLYGSYLPIAEILTEKGSFLTPSSASRYSFLEYNDRLILGGLMIFQTSEIPQTFYLNFNQIPFDTEPLSQGFTHPIILDQAPDTYTGSENRLSNIQQEVEFTLLASAQTNEETMLQPAVRMERADEKLSKFGWIEISDPSDSKRYPVTRGNLYGFNLTDDTEYSPAHAYGFAPLFHDTMLTITMDHAYVVRTFAAPKKVSIPFSQNMPLIIDLDEDFNITIYDVISRPDEDRIRLLIDRGGSQISDLSFIFYGLIGIRQPSVNCGIETTGGDFACDIYFDDISFPLNELNIEIDAVEYKKEGPWTITWNPVPMSKPVDEKEDDNHTEFEYISKYPLSKEQPDEVQAVLNSIELRNRDLTNDPGWICESYELDYQFSENADSELISEDRYENYFTHYISESWYHVENDSQISEILSLIRDPESGKIISCQWQRPGKNLDLVHALLSTSNEPSVYNFSCFEDFRSIAESSSSFLTQDTPSTITNDTYQLVFTQSLTGQPYHENSQKTEFLISVQDHFIIQETVRYDQIGLKLIKNTLSLEKTESLPNDIITLMESIK